MKVVVDLAIHPVGKDGHVAEDVAKAVRIIEQSGLEHDVGPGSTTIVGNWDEVFNVIKSCHEELSREAYRVQSTIHVDHEDDIQEGELENRVRRVKELAQQS